MTLSISSDSASTIDLVSNRGPSSLEADRGGSQLIELENGRYMAVTHNTFLFPARYYSQRLVLFEKAENGFTVLSHSHPFVFQRNFDVEFGSGIALSGEHVFITFGMRDLEAWICKIPTQVALALASEVPYKSDKASQRTGRGL